jgi:hypothetical protein
MTTESQLDIRPRTAGEVLDDAIRLALADAPVLLALSGLFLVPAFVSVLLLLALPAPGSPWRTLWLPALAALLLPLTGLGSGACQELLRRRANDMPVSLGGCLRTVRRHGLDHVFARALALTGVLLGLALLVAPGLAVWLALATVHAGLVAGDPLTLPSPPGGGGESRGRRGSALRESARALQRNSAKVVAVGIARLAATAFVFLNLHFLASGALWAMANLVGFDVALLNVQLVLTNPAYCVSLVLLAWWLLAPFAEACNYLLHVDTRVRYEGLDLWHRVQRLFPLTVRKQVGAILLATAGVGALASQVRAEDERRPAIAAARQEIERISDEVKRAEPYRGGARWQPRLRTVAANLKRATDAQGKRWQWFDRAIEEFGRQNRAEALRILGQIDARLALLDESLADAERSLLNPEEARKLLPDKAPIEESKNSPDEPPPKKREPIEIEVRGGGSSGPAIGVPAGFGMLGWMLLVGLFAACIVVAIILYVQQRKNAPKIDVKRSSGETPATADDVPAQPDQISPAILWQEADDLARQGKFLEAVRRLYLAVLSLLHRARVIRYERTRTNGEYLREARQTPETPAGLHAPFGQLTRLFDQKWYGDRACDDNEFGACRALAEEVRAELKA